MAYGLALFKLRSNLALLLAIRLNLHMTPNHGLFNEAQGLTWAKKLSQAGLVQRVEHSRLGEE